MKKIASLLMVIFMVFTLMSWSVFAEDNGVVTEDPEPAIEEVEEGSDVAGNPVVTEETEDSVSSDENKTFEQFPSTKTYSFILRSIVLYSLYWLLCQPWA